MARSLLLLFAVLVVLVVVGSAGNRKLANPDEGRYSEISREMAATGDWVTPRLNALKYFEKPPMQYWATALSFKLLGESEFSARLWTALACILCMLLITWTGVRLYSAEFGTLAALTLIACPYFLALGKIVTLDMGLTFFTTLAVCTFMLSQRTGAAAHERRALLLLAWAGMAGAVLSKGLIGLLFPGAALFLYALTQRNWRLILHLNWGWGLLLFFAIAAPWFIAASDRNPEFARFFFIHEHFERFLTTAHRRVQPWWFFVPILFGGVLPWALMLPAAIRHAWQSEGNASGFRPLRFAVIWCGFILVFFSVSGSKLPAYLLPAFPPLALVLARYLNDAGERKLAWFIAPGAILALIGAYAAWHAPEQARDAIARELYTQYRTWIVAACAIFLASVCIAFAALHSKRRWFGIAAIALGSLAAIEVIESGYETLSPLQSGYATAEHMRPYLAQDSRIYSVEFYDQTLPFYLKRPVTLVNYFDELSLGITSEPEKAIRDIAAFPAEWMRPGAALAIMNEDKFAQLKDQGLPMQIIHQDPRRIVVIKP